MAKQRPQMTSVDYVVIALSPLLIMVLVGSLCFFLLEVGYRGQFSARLHWILFWFVVGTVGIARISMEEGGERASVYGLGLAGAVAIAVLRFVDSPWIAWGLMALTWWCAHKLTWDCTLIDDEQDASGEGLLQVAGLEEGIGADGATTHASSRTSEEDDKPKRPAWWQRLFESAEERRKRPHAPGVWVIYFSLAALPLFGIGQAFIPAVDIERRRQAFWLLVWYVASGMGLLLTTSFLGLRRYLRQRKLEMPLTMTGAWLGVGAALIVILVLVTMLVPRPNPEYPVENLVANAISSPLREASRRAFLRDSAVQQGPGGAAPGTGGREKETGGQGDKETRRQGDKEGAQLSGGQQSGGQQSGGQQSGGQQSGGQQSGGQQSGGQQSGGQQSGGQQSGGQQSGGQQSGGQQSGWQQSVGQQSGGQQSGGQQSGGQQSGGQQSGGQQSGGQQSGGQQSGGQQSGGQQSGGQQSGGQQSGGQQSGGQQSGGQQSGGQQSGGQQSGGQQSGGQQSGGQQSGGQQSGGQQSGGQQSGGQQSGGQQSGGQQSGGQQSGGQQSGGQQSGGQQSGGQQSGSQQSGGQQNGNQPSSGQQDRSPNPQSPTPNPQSATPSPQPPASSPQPHQQPTPKPQSQPPTPSSQPQKQPSRLPDLSKFSLATWIRWLFWGVLAVAAFIAFLKYQSQVMAFLRQLWAELRSSLNGLFGGRKPRSADAIGPQESEPPRPFAAFRNPFYSGKASRLSPDQLVRYTFEALEAWTFERGAARRREETPLEFAEALSQRFPALVHDARQLARLYSQMVYARTSPARDCLPVLQRLWDEMSRGGERPEHGRPQATARG